MIAWNEPEKIDVEKDSVNATKACDLWKIVNNVDIPERIRNLALSILTKKATSTRELVDSYISPRTWMDEQGCQWMQSASSQCSFPNSVITLRDIFVHNTNQINSPAYGCSNEFNELLCNFAREILRMLIFVNTKHADYFEKVMLDIEDTLRKEGETIDQLTHQERVESVSDIIGIDEQTNNEPSNQLSSIISDQNSALTKIDQSNDEIFNIAQINYNLLKEIAKTQTEANQKSIEEIIAESLPDS